MAYKPNEKGWEYQDRTDAEMAADISKDRNMLDFCAYNNNGYAYVTLAGIMKAANEEGISVLECDVTETDTEYSVFVKVGKKPEECGWQHTSFSTRNQAKSRNVQNREGNWVDQVDPHAKTIAVNVAIKNAFKNMLYGSVAIEQMLNEFLEKNPKPPERNPNGNGNGSPPPQQQQSKPKPEEQPVEQEQETEEEQPVQIDLPPGDQSESEEWAKWKESLKSKSLEDIMATCHDVYKNSLQSVFDARELKAVDATDHKFGRDSRQFTHEDAIEWLDAMCLCLNNQGWLFRWMENGGKLADEDKEDESNDN